MQCEIVYGPGMGYDVGIFNELGTETPLGSQNDRHPLLYPDQRKFFRASGLNLSWNLQATAVTLRYPSHPDSVSNSNRSGNVF